MGSMTASIATMCRLLALPVLGIGATACAHISAEREYRIVGYAYQRTTDIDRLDVTRVTHLNYSFGLIYNDEYQDIDPGAGQPFGTPDNSDVRTPEPVPEGKLHTIYLPDKVRSDLSRVGELKEKNPRLKVLLSVGGWEARGFSDMAATAETRAIFARSALDVIEEFGLDGIDLDWEFPVIAGWGTIKGRPEDRENFTLLVRDVRAAIGPDKLLTVAGSPNLAFTGSWTEFGKVVEMLDFINIMTYDFQHDSYFGSALYASKAWPAPADTDYHAHMAIQNYIAHGAPPEKINLGLAFAAPIPAAVRSSPAFPAIRTKLQEAGFFTPDVPGLRRVKNLLEERNGFLKKWDEDARNMYVSTILDDGTEHFVLSYIEPTSISAKTDYIKEHRLGGVFFWEFGADYDGSIVTQLHAELVGPPAGAPSSEHVAVVRPGIEVFLADVPERLRGKRVGLITNHTGIDRARTPDIDLIAQHEALTLVALLAPEHGIRGDAMDGVKIADEVDARTGVPIYSLYLTEDQGPSPAILKDVDLLVYDLQEVGGRTWTYVSTMALSMKAAAAKGIPFVVLDRPNPIGGEVVEGALLDPRFKSFVGMYPIPARHGMTVGELATLFNEKYAIGADLIVARTTNWRRRQRFDETGLPWVNPSPNLRSLAALESYPGSVYFEGTTLTEGRGTERPFEQIGAPWLKAAEVARVMNDRHLPGIRFEPITMSVLPTAAKYPGQTIPAIRFAITDRQAYRPVRTALLLIDEIRRQHPRDFAWTGTIDRLTGSDKVRLAIEGGHLEALLEEWDREAADFRESRKPFLLYR